MNDMTIYRLSRIAWLFCLALIMAGCSSDEISSPLPDDGEIKPGDPVMFATYIQGKAQTRTVEEFNAEMAKYKTPTENYIFTYYIYNNAGTQLASGSQLYWPDNTQAYGFKATAGTEELENDQSTKAKYLLQDRLEGFGYEPIWNGSAPVDNIDGLNYRTCVAWKAANVDRGVDAADQKKIPLYLKHLRSRITVILVAGTGVKPEELAFATASTNIAATIYSYGTPDLNITPYAIAVNEGASTQYTAIVEPHNYQTSSDNIARISISGQPFTFSVSNESDNEKKSNYNLTAGKHLIITATLTRAESFQVLMKAQITDWNDVEPSSVTLDDLGQVIN